MRTRFYISMAIFSLAGLLGPLIWWASRLTNSTNYIHNIVAMLWPTWMLATFEYSTGKVIAAFIAVGANVLVFAFLGLFVSISFSQAWRVISFTIITLTLIWLNYWLNNWHFPSLIITIVIFIGLYWILAILHVRNSRDSK